MNILEALIQLRDDIKLWCTNNFNNKLNENLGQGEADSILMTDTIGQIVTTKVLPIVNGGTGNADGYIRAGATGTIGLYATAEGRGNEASGDVSHAEGSGTTASGMASHAEGIGTVASDDYAHAEGDSAIAEGYASHAEGSNTTAAALGSHAEGYSTEANGDYSHAEGDTALADGQSSHAEGQETNSVGIASHAEGIGTIATGDASHVEGKYNVEDADGAYAHIVGNGTSRNARSNAHALDWDGNAWFAGDVYVRGVGEDNANAKKLAVEEEIQTKLDGKIPFAGGVSIPSGANMDDYTTVGVYISSAKSISQSLTNPPVTNSGFKLVVVDGYVSGRVSHFVTTNTGNFLFRQYNGSTWTNWVDVAGNVSIERGGTGATTAAEARTNLGVTLANLGVTASAKELNKLDGVTTTTTELNYVDGVTSNIQTQLDHKADKATTLEGYGITDAASKSYVDTLIEGLTTEGTADAAIVQASLKAHTDDKNNPHEVTLTQLGVTATAAELNKLDGITDNIQTQLDSKMDADNTYWYSTERAKNTVLAAPNGASGSADFRSLVAADLPIVPVSKGGTGATTEKAAEYNLFGEMIASEDALTDNSQIVFKYSSPNSTKGVFFYRPFSLVWSSIANKIRSVFGFTNSNVLPITNGGTGATTAAKALTNLGITATAAELNKLDGVTASTSELNYVDGVTSNIQTQLNGKIPFSGGTNIVSNDNMDNYKTVGAYISGAASISATLTNTPIKDSGFKLLVIDGYISGRVTQIITTNNEYCYYRQYNGTTWTAWINITGTVPIERGGTGATSAADALANLGGISADNTYHYNTSRTKNTVLAAPNGSNGKADFRVLVADDLPTVPISKGGTGATTAAKALTNLGITATATELNYVDGVTSNIQTQLNSKINSGADRTMVREYFTKVNSTTFTTPTNISKIYTVAVGSGQFLNIFTFDYYMVKDAGQISQWGYFPTDTYQVTAVYNSDETLTFATNLSEDDTPPDIVYVCGYY